MKKTCGIYEIPSRKIIYGFWKPQKNKREIKRKGQKTI
jgi:hypothetical protein